jgi:hypothetical protein
MKAARASWPLAMDTRIAIARTPALLGLDVTIICTFAAVVGIDAPFTDKGTARKVQKFEHMFVLPKVTGCREYGRMRVASN